MANRSGQVAHLADKCDEMRYRDNIRRLRQGGLTGCKKRQLALRQGGGARGFGVARLVL